jgi:hypothetical protein
MKLWTGESLINPSHRITHLVSPFQMQVRTPQSLSAKNSASDRLR